MVGIEIEYDGVEQRMLQRQYDAAVLGTDRIAAIAPAARGRDARRLREAVQRCEDTRTSLELNVSEELALSALTLRLERLVGSAG